MKKAIVSCVAMICIAIATALGADTTSLVTVALASIGYTVSESVVEYKKGQKAQKEKEE